VSGAFLIKRLSCSLGFKGFTPDAQLRVLTACILAVQGKVDAGLIRFGKKWDSHLTTEELEWLARLADNAGVEKYLKTLLDNIKAGALATSYYEALTQAAPKLYTFKADFAEGLVTVRNHRGGAVHLKHLCFAGGGAVTNLTTAEYLRVRDYAMFQSYLECGVLEVVSIGRFVKEL
jgi:hypothetical protein